uniref:Ovule protein n=1 Tax=Panagrolaimus sp. JU765 TaxID=591449 RepID=A0AC34Q9W2_9BILA
MKTQHSPKLPFTLKSKPVLEENTSLSAHKDHSHSLPIHTTIASMEVTTRLATFSKLNFKIVIISIIFPPPVQEFLSLLNHGSLNLSVSRLNN